jgi:hypothetical protein
MIVKKYQKMKNTASIVFIIAFCAACSQAPVTNDIILDLNSVSEIDSKAEIPLSGLGWAAELIPLQTPTEESLIRDIEQIEESADFFWILTDRKVLQFGKDGSFIGQAGGKGPGPEEYVGAQRFCLDEKNKELYVMDYFGRKMVVFNWDGSFVYAFPLPEDYTFNNFFRSEDGKIYFYSVSNSVMPDILLYNPQTLQTDTLSYREREMGVEALVGNTTMYDLQGDTYVYHYFNDTVYSIRDNRLQPAWFISASKLTFRFEEKEMVGDISVGDFTTKAQPNGPRMLFEKVVETVSYIFVFYTLTEYKGEPYKHFMAMYDKKDGTYYPHINIVSEDKPWLSLKDGVLLYYSPASDALLAVKEAADLIGYNVVDGLREDDNPVIVRFK